MLLRQLRRSVCLSRSSTVRKCLDIHQRSFTAISQTNNSSSSRRKYCSKIATHGHRHMGIELDDITRNWQLSFWPKCVDISQIIRQTYTLLQLQLFYGSLDSVWDNPGEPIPKETFTHSHHPSWSSIIPYLLLTSITINGILPVQFTCLTIFFHNHSPSFLWSTSWPGTLHFILHSNVQSCYRKQPLEYAMVISAYLSVCVNSKDFGHLDVTYHFRKPLRSQSIHHRLTTTTPV